MFWPTLLAQSQIAANSRLLILRCSQVWDRGTWYCFCASGSVQEQFAPCKRPHVIAGSVSSCAYTRKVHLHRRSPSQNRCGLCAKRHSALTRWMDGRLKALLIALNWYFQLSSYLKWCPCAYFSKHRISHLNANRPGILLQMYHGPQRRPSGTARERRGHALSFSSITITIDQAQRAARRSYCCSKGSSQRECSEKLS